MIFNIILQIQPTELMNYSGYWVAMGIMAMIVAFFIRSNRKLEKKYDLLQLSMNRCYEDKLTELKKSFANIIATSEMAQNIAEIKREINSIHEYENETVKPKLVEFTNALNQITGILNSKQA